MVCCSTVLERTLDSKSTTTSDHATTDITSVVTCPIALWAGRARCIVSLCKLLGR